MRLILSCLMVAAVGTAVADLSYVECTGGFATPAMEGGQTELEFADIDNDGNIDILSIGDHGNPYVNTDEHGVMVWFGDGAGNWTVFQYGEFGYGGIAVGDVNWDGKWDIGYGMHHNYSGVDLGDDMLEVALGDGTGRMWTAWDDSLVPGGSVWGMFSTDFADVDNDGDLDVGSCSFGSGVGIRVFLNNGNGTWQQTFGLGDNTNSQMQFYFRDVNLDGNADILSATAGPAVYFGNGAGGFVAGDSGLPRSDYGLSGVSAGDADNDGGCDIAFANDNGGVEVWVFDDATRRWQSFSGTLPSTGDFEGTQLCDMNADGCIDLCAQGGAHTKVWTGDGQGNWTEAADITTPTPGDYKALRSGADFDHNGFPDVAQVADEGSWPSDYNRARAFREASSAESLTVFPVFPRGREKFLNNSVQFVDWWSAAPHAESTRVRLELSLTGPSGPWQMIADTLRNAGRFQWVTPDSVVSPDCHVRYTVTGPSDTAIAVTPRAFAIGDTVTGVNADRSSPDQRMAFGPNPAHGRTLLRLARPLARPARMLLRDVTGRTVTARVLAAGRREIELDFAGLSAGLYFATLDQPGSATARLLLQR
jgi:hypothetical protein